MGILSDVNTTIKSSDMLMWYNEEYIPFILEHLDDVIEMEMASHSALTTATRYIAYIPAECISNDPDYCYDDYVNWLLNNNKILHICANDDKYRGMYCYSDEFLSESGLFAHKFNKYFWDSMNHMHANDNQPKNLNHMYADDNQSKNSNFLYSIPDISRADSSKKQFEPSRFVVKVDYSSSMQYSFPFVYDIETAGLNNF